MNCEIPRAKKILRKAAKEKRVVDAFVTFTPGSFLKAYTQLERTYLFTSNNKAFASPSCSGYSIFGDCMDGQDSGVRLERYMADEKGGKDGWKIENCGIIKYQLLSAHERGMSVVGYYDTLKDANRVMWLKMADAVHCTSEELYAFINENEPAGECGLGKMSAWANNAGPENSNVDWKIVPIYMDGSDAVIFEEA